MLLQPGLNRPAKLYCQWTVLPNVLPAAHLEVIWQLCPACIARVHGDEHLQAKSTCA
jgi:hypothetical protein